MDINFFLPQYKIFPYEKYLLEREIASLTTGNLYADIENNIILSKNKNDNIGIDTIIKRSTYIDKLLVLSQEYKTEQSLIEQSSSQGRKKQSTRYLSHGIHEYRGKFNPQVARSILNILNISQGMSLFDPFCGSGTTLLEAARLGISAFGCDINPFAIFITTAKINALNLDIKTFTDCLYNAILYAKSFKYNYNIDSERHKYLSSWIPFNILSFLEGYRLYCKNIEYKEVYLALASNLIRDYSYQEPSDLRIRRRISAFPNVPIDEALSAFGANLAQNLENHSKYNTFSPYLRIYAEVHDIRDFKNTGSKYDVALTSPPYATALPYIDTHRISMVWLGLIEASEINSLEKSLVGSREMSNAKRINIIKCIDKYKMILPVQEVSFCSSLIKLLGKDDGFRRQAVPALLLRYFSDMYYSLQNILAVMKPKTPFALIVGTNKTTLGGKKIEINTPAHIVSLGLHAGWKLKEIIPLQTYQRYGIHSKNSINTESLILLEAP